MSFSTVNWYFIGHCNVQSGDTALMMFANRGHDECVAILVANGADVNVTSEVIEGFSILSTKGV